MAARESASTNSPLQNESAATQSTPEAGAAASSTSATETCTNCSKPETNPEEKPLKPCVKCHSVQYCSRDCQKGDFKQHKKICASAAQAYAQNADLKIASAPRVPKEGHRGGLQKWQFDT